MKIQPSQIIGALVALGVYPPKNSSGFSVAHASLENDITGLSGSATTAITWDAGDFDPGNPTRIYVPYGFSFAQLTGMARSTGSGNFEVRAWKNGQTANGIGFIAYGSASPGSISLIPEVVPVVPGDYFELAINRTTSLTAILSNGGMTSFSLVLYP